MGITHTKVLSWAAITAVLVNIPLNYLLIFTFQWGISGAALASTLAEMGSLIVLLVCMWTRVDRSKYGLTPVYDGKLLKKIWQLSVWSMLYAFISVAPWFLFFVAIERLGKTELAVSNIIRSVSMLFFVIVNSFAATTGSLVSNLIGAGQGHLFFPLCRRVLRLGYGVGLPLAGIAVVCRHWVIGFYTEDARLVQQALVPFTVMLLNYVFALPGYVYMNAVTGTGHTRVAFIFQLATIVVYLLWLYGLSCCTWASLAIYLSAEYLFVILLAVHSVIYLKRKHY